jgi:hypothetical protein
VTAATAANPMNRHARTATRRRASPRSCSATSRVVGDGVLDAEGALRFLEGLFPSASSSKQWLDRIEQTKLDLVGEIAAESDLILRGLAPPQKMPCIPPAPKLST